MIQGTIEKNLSKLLGRAVSIGELDISPLRGTVELADLRVAGGMLHVRKISGRISMAKALAKNISIKSMVIEGVELRLDQEDLRLKSPRKSGKKKDNAESAWRLEAGEISLKDMTVEFPALNLSAGKISGEIRHGGSEARYDFEIGELKLGGQILNPRPVHIGGALGGVENLLSLVSARLQLGVQVEVELGKVIGGM